MQGSLTPPSLRVQTSGTAHLVPGLRLLPLDDLQLLLVVGAHVAAPAQLPAGVLHLAEPHRQKLRHTALGTSIR